MTTYYVTMSDGETRSYRKNDAATAIQCAIEDRIGKTVAECHSGDGSSGIIRYEIPKHHALSRKPKKVSRERHERLPNDHPAKQPMPEMIEWLKKQKAKQASA